MIARADAAEGGQAPRRFGLAAAPANQVLLAGVVAAALAGCTNGAGSLLVDPGHYSAYHCNDLAAQ